MKNVFSLLLLLLVPVFLVGCGKSPQSATEPSSNAPTRSTASTDPANSGSISGVISFKGTAPKLPAIDMTADPGCPQSPQSSDALAVNDGKLANVFVYIKDGLPPRGFPAPSDPVVLDQKGCRYVPHMMGIMVGQPFKITNSDSADHNIHDLPKNNPQWNESQMAKDPAIVKTFKNPEMMLALQCNQHPWMRAYINVMSNPYYAVSAPDGSFTIRNLPPGEYTVAAMHEKFGEKTMKVKVDAKGTAKADLAFAP
jgi:plastocyanin